jgi:hypothetical protein
MDTLTVLVILLCVSMAVHVAMAAFLWVLIKANLPQQPVRQYTEPLMTYQHDGS